MVAGIIIIAVSCTLFFYWFRYVCVLILSTAAHRDYAREVAAENRLSFVHLPEALTDVPTGDLDSVARSLQQDYARVNFLLKQATELEVGSVSSEQYILRLDFLLMSGWYWLSSRFSSRGARAAVSEMRQVVAQMANGYGEQVAGAPRAG